MKTKKLVKAVEVAANIIVAGSAAKSLYDKFTDPIDDEDDDDLELEDDDDEED